MVDRIPVDKLYHPGVVVRDARATARNYAEIFGINKWNVAHYAGKRLTNTSTHGYRAEHSFTAAYGTSDTGVTFQLIEPGVDDTSTYKEFICTRGEGFHDLCTAIVPQAEFPAVREWFASQGIEVAQTDGIDNLVDWYFFDTRKALGGYQIMVVVPRVADWMNQVKFDEQWDFSSEVSRPDGVGPVPLPAIDHFGVVVEDVVERVRAYAQLYGVEKASFADVGTAGAALRSAVPALTLRNATYCGKPAEHRLCISVVEVADFGFEVIQTTVGPMHYKEDFLELVGPGIHHFNSCILDDHAECEKLNQWLNSIGIPVVQSGEPRTGMAYYYLDTLEKLGGCALEVRVSDESATQWMATALRSLSLDFSSKVAV